jgi:hypothetical protein
MTKKDEMVEVLVSLRNDHGIIASLDFACGVRFPRLLKTLVQMEGFIVVCTIRRAGEKFTG